MCKKNCVLTYDATSAFVIFNRISMNGSAATRKGRCCGVGRIEHNDLAVNLAAASRSSTRAYSELSVHVIIQDLILEFMLRHC